MFDERSWLPFIAGIILMIVGIIPLLTYFGILAWNISFLTGTLTSILTYVVAAGALFLIVESFMERLDEPKGVITIVIGLVLLALGILPVIGIAIPIVSSILTPVVYYFLFTIEGLILFIGAFALE